MLVHGRYPPSITKSKTGVEQTKENPNLHSYRSIFTRGSLCSRWTLQIQKTIEGYRVEHPFYFLFSHPKISNEILTHYLYPPELWKECIRKAVLGRGSGGFIPTPPPSPPTPFPSPLSWFIFPVHNKQGLWEDVPVLLVRSEIAMQHWYFCSTPRSPCHYPGFASDKGSV